VDFACATIFHALFTDSGADAAWSPATTIAHTNCAGFTRVATDSAGDTVFAWREGREGGTAPVGWTLGQKGVCDPGGIRSV